MNIDSIQRKIDKYKLSASTVKLQLKKEKRKCEQAKNYLRAVEEARRICQDIAQTIQRQAHTQIQSIVTICLQTIFGPDYSFEILFVKKRGKTEAKLNLKYKNNIIENPLDADSGGVLDVAGFALRLSCLMLSKPFKRKLIVLDEPFKNLHGKKYRERVKTLLEKLAKDFKVQVIMVTGIQDFHIGKVVAI